MHKQENNHMNKHPGILSYKPIDTSILALGMKLKTLLMAA